MAEATPAYLLDDTGKVTEAGADEAPALLSIGYTPAGKSQVEDFLKEKAFHEKYGTLGQQAKTFGEGGAQSLTLGLSTFGERALGVNPEDIKSRQEENPGVHLAGSITGAALPIIATAGASALPEGIGEAASLTAPGLIARAGEATSEGVAGLLGEHAATAVGRIAAKAASAGAGSAIEGASWGLGQVVHESALGDPNLTASRVMEEVGLSALLGGGIGAGMGVLGHLVGETAGSTLGKKVEDWLVRFEGNRNIKTAGGIQSDIAREVRKIGLNGVNQLGREGGELGLVDTFSTPAQTLEKSEALMESSGQHMGEILQAADAAGADATPSAARVFARFRNEVLAPIADNPLEAGAARQLGELADAYEGKFGAANPENRIGLKQLHDLRKQVSDKIYGLGRGMADPSADAMKSSLHDFRDILSEEIEGALKKAALPDASVGAWKQANREYQVAATFAKFAEKGTQRQVGNNLIPLTSILSALGGGVVGGPVGGLAMGALGYLGKRFGSGVLAAGSRAMRQLVDDGAAEGLASKTAEAIATAREAGVEGAAQAEGTAMARAWQKVSETLGDPVGSPTKDFLRDTSREKLAQQPEGTPVETVAALSHLERASQRVENRVQDGASALLSGTAKVGKGGALAGVASAFAKDSEDAHSAYAKRAEKVRSLAAQPDLLQKRLEAATASLTEHAPNTAQAVQVTLARTLNVLNQALGPPSPHAPLEEPLPPTPDAVARFHRVFEVVQKPSILLKQAAAGTLTPEAVAAVQAAHPQAYAHMQQAVLEKLASRRGPVPYAQRQMVSLLMGRDMDGTQSPQAIAEHQAAASIQAPPHAGASTKPPSKGLEKLHLSNRMLTPAQAATARGVQGD